MSTQDDSSSGIFSGVFGFITRELESFVATATGAQVLFPQPTSHINSPPFHQVPYPSTSSRRSSRRSHKRRKHSKRRDPTPSSSSEHDSDDSWHKSEDEGRTLPKSHRKRRREHEPHVSKSRRRVVRTPSPSSDQGPSSTFTLFPQPNLLQIQSPNPAVPNPNAK